MSISEDTVTGTPDTTYEHEDMVNILDELIDESLYKFLGDDRIRNKEREKVRIQYVKRTEQAIRTKRAVVKDNHLQEMGRTLEDLQKKRTRLVT